MGNRYSGNLRGTRTSAYKIGLADFDSSALAAARTYTIPDASGTLALLEAANTWTNTQTTRLLQPSADNTYDLGAAGAEWRDIYVNRTAFLDYVDAGVSGAGIAQRCTGGFIVNRIADDDGATQGSFRISPLGSGAGIRMVMFGDMAVRHAPIGGAEVGIGVFDSSGIHSTLQLTATGATSGVGYATGAGGTVTQATDKSTGVTLNRPCGTITMNNAALAAATVVSFTLTNSVIAATDVIVLNHASAGTLGVYGLNGTCAAGSAQINVRNNTAGSLSEAIVLRFAIVKAVTA